MIFDRGATFTDGVVATLRSVGVDPTRTSYRSPRPNGVAERFVGTVRPQQGLSVRAAGGAPSRRLHIQRHQPPQGRQPASPLRLEHGGVADHLVNAPARPIASRRSGARALPGAQLGGPFRGLEDVRASCPRNAAANPCLVIDRADGGSRTGSSATTAAVRSGREPHLVKADHIAERRTSKRAAPLAQLHASGSQGVVCYFL
jgi:hypothetical protein